MKKIIVPTLIAPINDRDTAAVIKDCLHVNLGMMRIHAAMLIALRINEQYENYRELLLEELNNPLHFQSVRLGVKSAWIIAVGLAENLTPADYQRLKECMLQWDVEEREGLKEWLADFPVQRSIIFFK